MAGSRDEAAARLGQRLAAADVRCAVVGLGFIGSTLMDALRAAGIKARGYDRALPGADPAICADAEVVILAVRLAVDGEGNADLEPLAAAAAMLRGFGEGERLVLLTSTVPPGTTRAFAAMLDSPVSFVAHVPERIGVGQDFEALRAMPHLVGGTDPLATDLAARFVGRFCASVHPVSAPEVSELSKLLENAFLSQGIALAGEVTRIAHALGVSAAEVCEAAATKTAGYFPFQPGYGLGGHCLPTDLRLLRAASRATGDESALLAAVEGAAALQPRLVVDRIEALLGESGLALAGARILLVGVGFKIGSPDLSATPAREIVRLLRARGASPAYADSGVPEFAVDGEAVEPLAPGARFDAAIVLAGDSRLSLAELRRCAPLALDSGGGRIMAGDRAWLRRM